MIGRYAKYLAGWAVVGALLLFALTTAFPGVAGESGRDAAIAAVLVAAFTDLAVFAIVLFALAADAKRFPKLWGLSIAVKAVVFGSAIALVGAMGWFPADGFVRSLIASFVTFAHHEIFWLALARPARPGAQPC